MSPRGRKPPPLPAYETDADLPRNVLGQLRGEERTKLKELLRDDPPAAEKLARARLRALAKETWQLGNEELREWQRNAKKEKLFDATRARRVWMTARDDAVCLVCRAMEGQQVVGLDTPFETPDGRQLMHPPACEYSAGAGSACRCCVNLRVD